MRTTRDDEFRAYVEAVRPRLVRTATLLAAGDRHLAEDVVQATLTRLYVAWPRIRRADGPDAYVRRALVNALIDERRRPFWRRETSHAEVPETSVGDATGSYGLADGGAADDFGDLWAALAALPEGMRAAVVFRHVQQLSVAEAAAALNCSEGNVKSQTARGLERLRAALARPDTTDLASEDPARQAGPARERVQPLSREPQAAPQSPTPPGGHPVAPPRAAVQPR